MPLVRRCPKCGDDLSTEEAVCVFCGHRLGRAGIWERIKLNSDDWIRIGAALVVLYFAGLNILLWGVGLVAPEAKGAVLARPWLERGLRWAIVAAAVGGAGIVEMRWRAKAKRREQEQERVG